MLITGNGCDLYILRQLTTVTDARATRDPVPTRSLVKHSGPASYNYLVVREQPVVWACLQRSLGQSTAARTSNQHQSS